MNNFFRIFSILKKLAKAKYYFLLPEKKDILIFDTNGADLIKSILPKNSYHILPTRYESLNFLFLINCLFSFQIRMRSYLQKYVDYINPKILITYIDNNPLFYELKLKHGKKFFIQNGRRTALDIFFSKNKLKKAGIAPPEKNVICPLCDSNNINIISEFGSTPCKAMYKCDDCIEPFEHFKCI